MSGPYVAHIVTADAQALGDPEIIIMTDAGETGEAEPLASYPLVDATDFYAVARDLLWENGWRLAPLTDAIPTDHGGYVILSVEPVNWLKIIEHATFERRRAEIDAERHVAAWRYLLRDAMDDPTTSATKLAAVADVSRERLYQIRDGR